MPTGEPDIISYVLAALRAAQGLTQKELADRTGFDKAQISRWETGREAPSVQILHALLTSLHTTPEEFFRLQGLLGRIRDRTEVPTPPTVRSASPGASSVGEVASGPRRLGEALEEAREQRRRPPWRPGAPTASGELDTANIVAAITDALRGRGERDRRRGSGAAAEVLGSDVEVLARESGRVVANHVRLFYRALAGVGVEDDGRDDRDDQASGC